MGTFTGSVLIIIAILPVFWGSSVELSMPTTISVNVTSPVSKLMAFFVVTICLLVILNLGWTLSPDCMIICEHPSGLPAGSLSASVQFKIATVVSRPKNIIIIYNVRMFHRYEKKLIMISNVQYVSKPIFPFSLYCPSSCIIEMLYQSHENTEKYFEYLLYFQR